MSLSLSSRDKTYRVELAEHVDIYTHWAPIHLEPRKFNEVRFSAFKGDRALALNEWLWDDASDDSRFFESFKYRWVTDAVLRFGGDESLPESKLDEVIVFNNTNHVVDAITIRGGGLFLILDLQPKAAVKLPAHPQPWQSWVGYAVRLGSGKPISYGGVNFFIRDDKDSHVSQHYCVAIRDSGVVIQSREVEGEYGAVPKGNDCAPPERRP